MTEDKKEKRPSEDKEEPKKVYQQYPNNSHKGKQGSRKPEKPKVEKIIEGTVIVRKKSIWTRIRETFTSDDAHSVGSFIFRDVIVPALQSMILDAGSKGLERALYGEVRRDRGPSDRRVYTSYNRMYDDRRRDDRQDLSYRARSTHNFREIVIPSRGEAEDILDALSEFVGSYEQASVSDLYGLIGLTPSIMDDVWGWTSLSGARVIPVADGYLLDLPRPQQIAV